MKTYVSVFGTLCLILTCASAMGQEPSGQVMHIEVKPPVAEVVSIQGKVLAIRGQIPPQPLDVSSPIYLLDRLTSGPGACAQIMFKDNSILALGENSEMTIDEYVYNPDDAAANRSLVRVFKGLFRVITARIADLNPDRYEVKSNMATIGIRGCEVGFDLRGGTEKIQIIRLPRGKSIHITQQLENGGSNGPAMVIERQGSLVQVRPGQPLSAGTLSASDIRALKEATTPAVYAGGSGTRRAAGSGQAKVEEEAEALNGVRPVVRTAQQAQALEDALSLALPMEEPMVETPTAGSGGGDPGSAYPILGPRVTLASGSGRDWSWGSWARDNTVMEGGSEVTRTEHGTSVTGNRISEAQFANIHQGSVVRLQGNGVAAAGLFQGSDSRLLEGASSLDVLAGGGVAPNWQGSFDLSSGQGDSLQFMANGTIDTDGSFRSSASPGTYNLNAMGSGYNGGSLSRNSVGGNLVGSNDEITGAIGDMEFDHGADGPKVRGVFGSDLTPR